MNTSAPRPVTASRLSPLAVANRSEEHTSELQSRQYLVCRLLLEKKKATQHQRSTTQDTTADSTDTVVELPERPSVTQGVASLVPCVVRPVEPNDRPHCAHVLRL